MCFVAQSASNAPPSYLLPHGVSTKLPVSRKNPRNPSLLPPFTPEQLLASEIAMADNAQQEAATLDVAGDVKAEPMDMEGDVKGAAKKDASEDRKADANAEMKEDAKAEVAGEEASKQNAEDDTTQRCGDGKGEALDAGEAKGPHRASQSARRFIRSLVEDMGERASASTLKRPARDESAE